MKGCIVFVMSVFLLGCGNDNVGPLDNTVHLAGVVGAPDIQMYASYWKDGVLTDLSKNKSTSKATSMYVEGTTALIGGYKYSVPGAIPAIVWENGNETIISSSFGDPTLIASRGVTVHRTQFGPDPSRMVINRNGVLTTVEDTSLNYRVNEVKMVGDDVYLTGGSSWNSGTGDGNYWELAKYWKNGKVVFSETDNSVAFSIFVHGSDVYMAGQRFSDPKHTTAYACYWKNGVRTDLASGAMARSIYVTEDAVYVAGISNSQAVYWKNGEVVTLTNTVNYSIANSIYVREPDVYVGGQTEGHPAYWKNGERQTIEGQEQSGEIVVVMVGSN